MIKRLAVTAFSVLALSLFSFSGVSSAASGGHAAGGGQIYNKIEDCQAQGNADVVQAGGPANLSYSCEPTDVAPGRTPDCPDGCIGGHWVLNEYYP